MAAYERDAMTDHVRSDVANGVLTLTLNRPEKKNALTRAMYQALGDAIDGRPGNDVRCILIQAEGDVFTAGNDLGDFAAPTAPSRRTCLGRQPAADRARARRHADRGGGQRPRRRRRHDHAAALRSRVRLGQTRC
jgi:enoyl-CoA hydratase/carnithine racemase